MARELCTAIEKLARDELPGALSDMAYCRELIDEGGGDGGFISSSGCSVPADARPENFRAMVETGKRC